MQIQLKHTHKQTHTHAHNYRKLAIVATGNLWQFIANLWQMRNALFAIAFVISIKSQFQVELEFFIYSKHSFSSHAKGGGGWSARGGMSVASSVPDRL